MKGTNLLVFSVVIAVAIGAAAGYLAARTRYKAQLLQKDAFIAQQDSRLKTLQAKEIQMTKAAAAMPDGVLMKEGKLWQVQNGQTMVMEKEVTMSDGTKVDTTGKVIMKDGSSMMLKDGEEVSMDGKVTDVSMMGK